MFIENFSFVDVKEVELAMWRKRASYDPMKAAAEGKKKQELARRSSQQSKYCDNRCERFAFSLFFSRYILLFTVEVDREPTRIFDPHKGDRFVTVPLADPKNIFSTTFVLES